MVPEKKGHLYVSGTGEIKIPLEFKATHYRADFDDDQPICEVPTCTHNLPDSIEASILRENDPTHPGHHRWVLFIQWSVNQTRKVNWFAKAPY